MVILYIPQETNTCSKSAAKTLEIAKDNSNEELSKKQPPDVFYKKCSYLVNLFSTLPESVFQ